MFLELKKFADLLPPSCASRRPPSFSSHHSYHHHVSHPLHHRNSLRDSTSPASSVSLGGGGLASSSSLMRRRPSSSLLQMSYSSEELLLQAAADLQSIDGNCPNKTKKEVVAAKTNVLLLIPTLWMCGCFMSLLRRRLSDDVFVCSANPLLMFTNLAREGSE